MPLYVSDEEVNRLAGEVQQVIGAATKTDAVRVALEELLAQRKAKKPLLDRLKAIEERARRLGTPDPDFGEKAFSDRMWGHED
jgi:antitoxin VapB